MCVKHNVILLTKFLSQSMLSIIDPMLDFPVLRFC